MIEAKRDAPRVNGGNDSASWPFPHLSAPAMDRHPRVDLRDFAESRSTRARKTKTATQKAATFVVRSRGCCVNGSHPPPTRHPREARLFLS